MKRYSVKCLIQAVITLFIIQFASTCILAQDSSQEDNEYVDVSAMKCPSSWDEEAKQFRSENYWIFQKRSGEDNASMVLRPNRDTGTWRRDVDTVSQPMKVTPDAYQWVSQIYTGLNTLDRKAMTLARDRDNIDGRSATSHCQAVSPEAARKAVEVRYQQR